MGACTFDYEDDYNGPAYIVVEEPPHDEYSYIVDVCYGEPYWRSPEWCDLYVDAECCTWYVDGWYEEWCDWGYIGCWEYYGSF
jgi:hypothetical protein